MEGKPSGFPPMDPPFPFGGAPPARGPRDPRFGASFYMRFHYNGGMTDAVLSCRNITKSFHRTLIPVRHLQERIIVGRRKKTQWSVNAVDDVSLRLAPGEWIGLSGPNGCGKTTLLRVLAGLLVPDLGSVERNATFSCFFELGVGFHEEHTAAENVRMHAMLWGVDFAAMRSMADAVRAFAGIGDHWNLPLKCYSTGMRHRLGFAVSTAVPGDVLLLDEIFAVGDAAFQVQCWERLFALKRLGHSAVMVSHRTGDLERICDRVFSMDGGKIMQEKTIAPITA